MPAIRKTVEAHELSGSYKKHPERRPKGETPKSKLPIGDPPDHMSVKEKATWYEFTNIVPAGVLTETDRWIVELSCVLMCKFRDKKVGLTAAELARLTNALSLMGATPVDRSRLTIKPTEDDNPFADLLKMPN